MSPQELSNLLWQERQLLDRLLFKLKVEQMLLAAGETRWLPMATAESEEILQATREVALARDVASQSVAEQFAVPVDSPLRDIAAAAPFGTPWPDLFAKHLQALTTLATEIKQVSDANAGVTSHAARSSQETLASLGARETTTYNASGSAASEPSRARLFDTTL